MGLLEAIEAGDAARVKELLSQKADANEPGAQGATPLIAAARMGRADLVRLLLDAGAEPEWHDDSQETALLKAAANGHRDVCAELSPLASPDDRDAAAAYLAAVGKTVEAERSIEDPTRWQRGRAEAGAFVSKVLGNENPAKRLDRLERAEKGKKK